MEHLSLVSVPETLHLTPSPEKSRPLSSVPLCVSLSPSSLCVHLNLDLCRLSLPSLSLFHTHLYQRHFVLISTPTISLISLSSLSALSLPYIFRHDRTGPANQRSGGKKQDCEFEANLIYIL